MTQGMPARGGGRRSLRVRAATIAISLAAGLGAYAAIAASLSGSPSGAQLAWAMIASLSAGLLAFISLRSALGSGERPLEVPAPLPVLAPQPARRQLPVDIDHFTDRDEELRELERLLGPDREPSLARPPLAVIRGGGGVGKSALALHAAHRMAASFPDAQLYMLLGGERIPPVSPGAALETLLRGLGLHHGAIPADLEERKSLYRSQLAGQRVLLLLDNVVDEEQVEPLLPASATCAVVVTSRRQLEGIEGAHVVELEQLPEPEAVRLLGQLIGEDRVAGDRGAAERIVRACGNLPLAVKLAGASLNTKARKRASLAVFAARLEDERGRLSLLKAGNRGIRAGFAPDYQGLSTEAARLFRLLGLLRVPDVGIDALAALVGLAVDEVESVRDELVNAHLLHLMGPAADRYGMHDLLRVFARERAEDLDPPEDQRAAVGRVLSWYLATADSAAVYIDPTRCAEAARLLQGDIGPPVPGRPSTGVAWADRLRASLDWFERERVTMVALIRQADLLGEHGMVWKLATSMTHFFDVRNHWTDWTASHELALRAARTAGHARAEAEVLIGLGLVHRSRGEPGRAVAYLQQAAEIAQRIGDRQLEGWARNDLGHVEVKHRRRLAAAAASLDAALRLFAEVGDRRGEASAYENLGLVYDGEHRPDEAIAAVERSLELFHELEEPWGQSWVLENLGDLYRERGLLDKAIASYEQALRIFREITRDEVGEGWVLNSMSRAYLEGGRLEEAMSTTRQALEILRRIDARDGIAQTLDTLGQLYRRLGRHDEAILCHQEGLGVYQELDNSYCMAVTLNSLGEIYGEQRSFSQAIEHHERALALFRQLEDPHWEAKVLDNLVSDYRDVDDPVRAEQYALEAAALAEPPDASP
jgi:tetratricopeptide (TPR) repeat protein